MSVVQAVRHDRIRLSTVVESVVESLISTAGVKLEVEVCIVEDLVAGASASSATAIRADKTQTSRLTAAFCQLNRMKRRYKVRPWIPTSQDVTQEGTY